MEHKLRTEFVPDYVAPYGQEITYGKIALEEHYESPDWEATGDPMNETARNQEAYFQAVKERLHSPEARIREMDRNGVEMFLMSLTQPGIQEILDPEEAAARAHEMNIWVYENFVQKYPARFNAFAAVALQDPQAACAELEFCVKELGFVGALVNGYTMKNQKNNVEYLDEAQNLPFWKKLVELDVPLYLHPRDPAPDQQRAYKGYEGLLGSAWGFGAETALHTLRLLCSGLFDELPQAKLVLGHLGEGLPFGLPRVQHRLNNQKPCGRHKMPLTFYFEKNVYITTSGHFHTQAFLNTLAECDSSHVMFSSDTPYESLDEASIWFDNVPLSYADRMKIGRENAVELFKLNL